MSRETTQLYFVARQPKFRQSVQYPRRPARLAGMQLASSVHIRRSPEHVWAYLGDISNVAVWDRGVSRSEPIPGTPPGVGFEFVTFAHPRGSSADGTWGKVSYRITEIDPGRGCTIQLTSATGNARYFKSAEWLFRVEAEQEGSRVFCAAVFMLKWRYLVLAPVFLGMKRAIRTDLEQLKAKLESARALKNA